jgi:hypothetical protein
MKLEETNKFLEVENLMSRDFYNYYRENRAYVAKGINQQMLFDKAVGGLLQTLGEIMRESEGGIHIKDFGYFCHVKSANKRKVKERNILANDRYEYEYTPWFFPEDHVGDWYFHKDVKVFPRVYQKLDKYGLYFDAIKSKYEFMAFGTGLYKEGRNIKY